MGDRTHLIYAIIKFLEKDALRMSEDKRESMEVVMQCLESVYDVAIDSGNDAQYPLPASLDEVFERGMAAYNQPIQQRAEKSVSIDKERAEKCKNEGNELMRQADYPKALECYSEAIQADATNAVYYCNRAAAHSKLNNHVESIADCIEALKIDPNYSKAYGRKGLAHSALEEHAEALKCYKKAVELDPTNASYQQNLEIAEQKISEREGSPATGGVPNLGGLNMGGMDFSNFLSNPALMNMATNMMQNPQMQQMMASFMGNAGTQEGGPQGLSGLLQAGQQLAQQMQQANPELVEELRNQMRPPNGSGQDDESAE